MEAWVLIGVLDVVIVGVPNMVLLSMVHVFVACHLLSIVVGFILLFNIYQFLFWVCRWYLLSTCSFYWPLHIFFFLLSVECSRRAINFNLSATLASLQYIRIQGELLFLARTGFSPSCLDVFEVQTWTISVTYFSFLNTLRFRNLRIDVLDVMTSRFWD